MFWTIHWNNYIPCNTVEEWNGEVDDVENTITYDNYEAAFGKFTIIVCDGDVARSWITVHKNSNDKEGNIMFAYSNRWEDKIEIDFE